MNEYSRFCSLRRDKLDEGQYERYNVGMKVVGIIAEYNPFHNGHRAQLEYCRREAGADAGIIVLMSGDFTQRGLIASLPSTVRADFALRSGADLVLQLPLLHSISSAEGFAHGAIATLAATGICSDIFCGAEHPEQSDLEKIADLLAEETDEWRRNLFVGLEEGLGFAAARSNATTAALPDLPAVTDIMKQPNNILAIEYLKAIRRLDLMQKLSLRTHPRFSRTDDNEFPTTSSTYIREQIRKSLKQPGQLFHEISPYVPPYVLGAVLSSLKCRRERLPGNFWCDNQDLTSALLSRLIPADADELFSYSGFNDGLAERVIKWRDSLFTTPPPNIAALAGTPDIADPGAWNNGFDYFAEQLQTRNLPVSRIRRAFLALLLDIRIDDYDPEALKPTYLRLLAANKRGRYLLRLMRHNATLPIISRPSEAITLGRKSTSAARQLDLDRRGLQLRQTVCLSPPL